MKFSDMSDSELMEWWQQYGCATQAGFYRDVPRRAARAELLRRGLPAVEHSLQCGDTLPDGSVYRRPDGYVGRPDSHPNGWLKNWGLR